MVHNLELYPDAAARQFAPPALPPSCSARKATSRLVRCLPAKFASFRSIAAPPLARSANVDNENQTYGKAGRTRWKGIRSHGSRPCHEPCGSRTAVVKGRLRAITATPWAFPDARQEDARQQRTDRMIVQAPEVTRFSPAAPCRLWDAEGGEGTEPRFRSWQRVVTKWTGAILNESAQGKQDGKRSSWLAGQGRLGRAKNASNTYTFDTRSRAQGAACEASSKKTGGESSVKPAVKVVVPLEPVL